MRFSFKKRTGVINKQNQPNSAGFLLPVVIFLGIGIGTVSVVALQSVANNSTTLNTQYYDSAAREAAQAGIASAAQCIKSNDRSWSADTDPATTLRPDTGCDGKAVSGRSAYVVDPADNLPYVSYYEVGNLQAPSSNTVVVTSTGTVKVKGPSGTYVSTTTSTVRTFAKSSTTPTGYISKNVTDVSTGPSTACAVAEGWVYCWGSNANKMVGAGKNFANDRALLPTKVADNGAATTALPGSPNPCGGFLQPGCVTDPTPVQPKSALTNADGSRKYVMKVSVGSTHVCVMAKDSQSANDNTANAYCWGDNASGQLGTRNTTDTMTPVAVDTAPYVPAEVSTGQCGGWFQRACNPAVPASALNGKNIKDISAGSGFTCALTTDGHVSCWGANDSGQLGTGNSSTYNYPVAVNEDPYVPAEVSTGQCGGWFQRPCNPAVPASALNGKSVKALGRVKAARTMCVIETDDKHACWGENWSGQTGNGTKSGNTTSTTDCSGGNSSTPPDSSFPITSAADELRPVEVQTTLKFDSITTFGGSDWGYTIAKTSSSSTNPNRVFYWGGTTDVSSKTRRACGSTGGTSGAGVNKYEWTGTRTYTGQTTPTGPLFNDSSAGSLNGATLSLISGNAINGLFCAQTTTNVSYCTTNGGRAADGQTGNGTVVSCSTNWLGVETCTPSIPSGPQPVKLTGALAGQLPITDIDTGSSGYTCAVAANAVYCWGVNSSGQAGVNNTTDQFEPARQYLDPPSDLGVQSSASGTTVWSDPVNF
jgi:alpha-tubulin suppressor-like RCC1 family protein